MRKLFFPLVVVLFSHHAFAGFASLLVNIENLKSNEGVVRVALFNSSQKKYFPSRVEGALDKKIAYIKGKKAAVSFHGLETGEYAVVAYHDRNNNGELDRSTFGRPKEPYGYSLNPERPRRGPVSFEKADFHINGRFSDYQLTLKLEK